MLACNGQRLRPPFVRCKGAPARTKRGKPRMGPITRRSFAKGLGIAGVGALAGASPRFAIAQTSPKVVIVGGGAGGATIAHYLKREAPSIDVTLIEANPIYSTSF